MYPSPIEFVHGWDHICIVVSEVCSECAWVDCVVVMLWLAKWVVLVVLLVEIIVGCVVAVLIVWFVHSRL